MEVAYRLLSASVGVQDARSHRQQLAALRLSLETLLPQGSPAQRRARWNHLCMTADPAWAHPDVHPGPGGRLKASFASQAQALQLELLAGLMFTTRGRLLDEIGLTLTQTLGLLAAGHTRGPALELQGMRLRALYLQMPPDVRQAQLRLLEQLPFQESYPAQRLRALSILTLRVAERGGVATRRALVDTATLDQLRGKPSLRFGVHRAMIDLACLSSLAIDEKHRLQRLCLDMPWPVPAQAAQTLSPTQTARMSASLRLLVLQALARDGVALKPVLALREAILALAARAPLNIRDEVLAVLEQGVQADTDQRPAARPVEPAPGPGPAQAGASHHRHREQAGGHDAGGEQQEGVVTGHRPKGPGRLG